MDAFSCHRLPSYSRCDTPATCDDSAPPDENPEDWTPDPAERAAQLKSVIDKISRDSYRSIECLKTTLAAVDRRITATTLPHACHGDEQARSVPSGNQRRFFYNRASIDSVVSCRNAFTVDADLPIETKKLQPDEASISSQSTITRPQGRKERSRKHGRVRGHQRREGYDTPQATAQGATVPAQLDGVFKGLKSLKLESERLHASLQQAQDLAHKLSQGSSSHSVSLPASKECQVEYARRVYAKLTEKLESSLRLASRLQTRINILGQKSRQKLSDIYSDIHIRQQFGLPPWPVRVNKPSPTLLRAQGGSCTSSWQADERRPNVRSDSTVHSQSAYSCGLGPTAGDPGWHPSLRCPASQSENRKDSLLQSLLATDPAPPKHRYGLHEPLQECRPPDAPGGYSRLESLFGPSSDADCSSGGFARRAPVQHESHMRVHNTGRPLTSQSTWLCCSPVGSSRRVNDGSQVVSQRAPHRSQSTHFPCSPSRGDSGPGSSDGANLYAGETKSPSRCCLMKFASCQHGPQDRPFTPTSAMLSAVRPSPEIERPTGATGTGLSSHM
ncbi:hypothetical protein CSUI_005237 [Cystoisospora suis]|uniref:Uncharacterized protein n=1 Tax=Cystoisospora suis TaxID=483139 RepID=A0A2C6KYC8_9APIC|nr:hypothetical protein CSUI_005237 [Cystoisospora suis]